MARCPRAPFPSPKAYISRLVKDYEALLHISGELQEELILGDAEMDDIFFTQLRKNFPGKTAGSLEIKEKNTITQALKAKERF